MIPHRAPALPRLGRHPLLVALALYSLLALWVLSPLRASYLVTSPADDLANHVSGVRDARNALAEGQFPVRVAPTQNDRTRYPIFQFYGNLPYTLGGAVNLLTPLDSYAAWKLVVFLSLIVGSTYVYKMSNRIVRQDGPAILAGTLFLTAPYMLTDILGRFAYPEVVSFGLIPVVFYYVHRILGSRRPEYILKGGVAWSAIALSHNITFFYSTLFVGIYAALYLSFNARFVRRALRLACSYVVGLALSAWYLAPQVMSLPYLMARDLLGSPTPAAAVAPLERLLAPTPKPLFWSGVDPIGLGFQVGWPILGAVFLAAVAAFAARPQGLVQRASTARLLLLFGFAFTVVWTPFDFWSRLPTVFWYVQFPYRILMFVVLFGAVLAAWAARWLRLPGSVLPTVVFGVIVGIATLPYLPRLQPSTTSTVDGETSLPNIGRNGANFLYQVAPPRLVESTMFNHGVNLARWDYGVVDSIHRLLFPGISVVPAPSPGDSLRIAGLVPKEFTDGVRLTISLDDRPVATVPLHPGEFNSTVPIPLNVAESRAQLTLQTDSYLDPVTRRLAAPTPGMLGLEIGSLTYVPAEPTGEPRLLSVDDTRPSVYFGSPTQYTFGASEPVLVELPVMFYPGLLGVEDNGRSVQFGNLGRFVALELAPGDHHLSVSFVGVVWMNTLSAATALLLLVIGCAGLVRSGYAASLEHLATGHASRSPRQNAVRSG